MDKPTKFTEKKRQAYLEALRKGARLGAAAASVGMNADYIRKLRKSDADFADECESAEAAACEPLETKLYEMALSGHYAALIEWLHNRAGHRWRDSRKADVSQVEPLTEDQLREQRRQRGINTDDWRLE